MEISIWEKFKKDKDFQRGVKMFREGKVPKPKAIPIKWVFDLVTGREWENYYRWDKSYCNLGKIGSRKDINGEVKGGKIKMAFCIADFGFLFKDCQELTDPEELRNLDLYRRALNVRPFPTTEV